MPLITADTPWYKRIKLYRIALELTQQEASDKIGVEHRRYWGWENGQSVPTPEHQAKLTEAFGVSHDDIFGGSKQDFTGIQKRT